MANEDQTTEIEVLESIYDGDQCFHMVNNTTFQYKFGEEGDSQSFLLEVSWPPEYPEVAPIFNLNAFYNNHLSSTTKAAMIAALNEEAIKNIGVPQVYTIFEWARDGGLTEVINAAEPPVPLALRLDDGEGSDDDERRSGAKDNTENQKAKQPKKEQLSKSQKRKEWGRLDNKGERPRGYDWVDVIKHLSQTGSKPCSSDVGPPPPVPVDNQAIS